jgi:hypothetical protein
VPIGAGSPRADAERLRTEVEKIVRQDNAEGIGSRHLFRGEEQRFRREGDGLTVESVRDGQARPLPMTAEALASLHSESTANTAILAPGCAGGRQPRPRRSG